MKLAHPERFNIDLAIKVLDHVILNPAQHQQMTLLNVFRFSEVDCGTVGCIAGWALVFGGGVEKENRSDYACHLLGLERDEFSEFYGDFDEQAAIETFIDYIAQARAVQEVLVGV